MLQRFAVVIGIVAAMVVGAFVIAAPASAAGTPNKSAVFQKKAKTAAKKAATTCKQAKRAKGKAKAKAQRRCKSANKQANKATKARNNYNAQYFDVCKNGCRFRTVHDGANAAGAWQKKSKRKATVRIQPGTYVEGVLLHGKDSRFDFDDLTIMGVGKNKQPTDDARAVILDGENATTLVQGTPGWMPGDDARVPANNAIEGRSLVGLKMMNMWARNYQNNTFFVWASNVQADNERCADFVMDNLVSSDTRVYGLFSRNCFGGKFLNSEGWNHGDSALYVGETPCDTDDWTNRGNNPVPCQADPDWTIVRNLTSHQNTLGYSGTNSKYVKITDSTFYNNGVGLFPTTLDSERFEPNGWLIIENNDIFWNNYNAQSTGSAFESVIDRGTPTGIGISLLGSDGVVVKGNNIFGNEQFGAATFSGPALFDVNEGDDAKSMNNQFIDNQMGRSGLDPNGNYDFFGDFSGGGNCWSGNTPGSTFAPGNGSVSLLTMYPACPLPKVINKGVNAAAILAGTQANSAFIPAKPWKDLTTIFGLYTVNNAPTPNADALQECSWSISTPHPPYTDADGISYSEERADPVSLADCDALVALP